jgi:regulator of protease activity HflC (stomatin/prohibitin superfamily)
MWREAFRQGRGLLMKTYLFAVFIAALLLALGSMAGACGDDDELTLEEYFQQMDTLAADFEDEIDRLGEEFQEAADEAETEEEVIDDFHDFSDSLTELFEDFVADVEGIDPPSEVEDAHNELAAAQREGQDLLEELNERAQRSESVSDVEDWSAEFEGPVSTAISDRTEEACFALQAIADDNDIDVDLECEEE